MVIKRRQPLATWRNLAHMTQEQFAEALGVDRSTVSQWENGRTQPRLKNIAKIEEVLNIRYFEDVVMPKVSP